MDIVEIETRICSKCGERLPINKFYKDKSKKIGVCSQCKSCINESKKQYHAINKDKIAQKINQYNNENKADVNEYRRKNYRANKEKICANRRIYQIENKDKVTKGKHQNYIKNKVKMDETSRVYRTKNKEALNEKHKQWRRDNPEKVNIQHQRRNANKRQLLATLTAIQWEKTKEHFNNTCAYCGKKLVLTQDHFLALSKNGEYTLSNIIPACRSCNSSKNNRSFFEWYPKYKYYAKKREDKILDFLEYEK